MHPTLYRELFDKTVYNFRMLTKGPTFNISLGDNIICVFPNRALQFCTRRLKICNFYMF